MLDVYCLFASFLVLQNMFGESLSFDNRCLMYDHDPTPAHKVLCGPHSYILGLNCTQSDIKIVDYFSSSELRIKNMGTPLRSPLIYIGSKLCATSLIAPDQYNKRKWWKKDKHLPQQQTKQTATITNDKDKKEGVKRRLLFTKFVFSLCTAKF